MGTQALGRLVPVG